MNSQNLRILAICFTFTSAMFAQQRQAAIVGGGSPDRGKCTVEVVVDDVAQVEIRGNTATLRTLSGQPAQWRRFECTSPMPANPPNFGFAGVDGRGRQELVRNPASGGVAVVQIQDKDGGAEGYTFDLTWGGQMRSQVPNEVRGQYGPPPNQQQQYGPPPNQGQYDRGQPPNQGQYQDRGDRDRNRDGEYYRRYGHGFGTDEAIRQCQNSVYTQASRRFRTQDIHFHRTAIDDGPGRQDWVTGIFDTHRGPREERYSFSCSVNFDSGRIRSAEIDPRPLPQDRWR
jgi:hypothetical protein